MNASLPKTKLNEISLDLLSDYLLSKGWENDGRIGETAIVWHRPEEHFFDFEILHPINKKSLDYFQRLAEVLSILSRFEKRQPFEVFNEIINFNFDVVRIRVENTDVEGGSIPLDDGVLLFEKAKELLVSSTLSTFTKKSFFSGSRSNIVQDFLNTLRFGQTEHGSYVVNVIAPVSNLPGNELPETESSITRAVSNNLANSLTAITRALDKYETTQNLIAFDEAVLDGVSANLCDALIGISGVNENRDIEVSINLAPAEKDNQESIKKHRFTSEKIPVLKTASNFYKGNYTLSDYNAIGLVVRLDHKPEEELGSIRINCNVNGVAKNISVQLILDQYWEAVRAHEDDIYISINGNLCVTPRSANLLEPKDFKVLGKYDLFDK